MGDVVVSKSSMEFSKSELCSDVINQVEINNYSYPDVKYIAQPTKDDQLFIINNGDISHHTLELSKYLRRKKALLTTGNILSFIIIEAFLIGYFCFIHNYEKFPDKMLVNSLLVLSQDLALFFTLPVILYFIKNGGVFKINKIDYYREELHDDNYLFYGFLKTGFTKEDNEKAKTFFPDTYKNKIHNKRIYDYWLNLLVYDKYEYLARNLLDRNFSSLNNLKDNGDFLAKLNSFARKPFTEFPDFVYFLITTFDNVDSETKENTDFSSNQELSNKNKTINKNKDTEINNIDSDSYQSLLIKSIKEDFDDLSNCFLNVEMNPETIIYKPLLLDVTYSYTARMIKSFNNVRELMNTIDYNDINDLTMVRKELSNAKNDFSQAETEAIKVGIPNINQDDRLTAIKSLKIVLDDNAYEEEKLSHWNNILKIVRKTGLKDGIVNKANNAIAYEIKNKKSLEIA